MRHDPANAMPAALSEAVRQGMALLLQARELAGDLDVDSWNFALSQADLRSAGLNSSELRWLWGRGWIAAAAEVAAPRGKERRFRAVASFALPDSCCFLLTDEGAAQARKLTRVLRIDAASDHALKPHYHGDTRTLCLGEEVVKCFRVPAENQELILAAFEEEGWPQFLDDPLPPQPDINPKRRLHNTISRLNRHQFKPLLRFAANGNGRGIVWTSTTASRAP